MNKRRITNNKLLLLICGTILSVVIIFSVVTRLANKDDNESEIYTIYTVRESEPIVFEGLVEAKSVQEVYMDASLGTISEFFVENFQEVEEGTPLFNYVNEDNQYLLEEQKRVYQRVENRLANTEADLANAQSGLKTIEENIDVTENELKNYKDSTQMPEIVSDVLDNNIEKVESEETELTVPYNPLLNSEKETLENKLLEFESEESELQMEIEASQTTVQEYKEQVEDVTAEVERLQNNITTTIKSRVNGVIEIDKDIEDFNEVREGPLVLIVSNDVEINSSVSEFDYENIYEGASVEIRIPNDDQTVDGKITFIDRRPSNGATTIESSNDSSRYIFTVNPDEFIQYGYSVLIAIYQNTIKLPKSSVLKENDLSYVFVYKNGIAERKSVEVEEEGDLYKLESGLDIDDEILLDVSKDLEDGEEVMVQYD